MSLLPFMTTQKLQSSKSFNNILRYGALGSSILLSIIIAFKIYFGHYYSYYILLWLLSLIGSLYFFSTRLSKEDISILKTAILISLVPTLVRALLLDINRVHGDEYILAYFTSIYDFTKVNFFGPFPIDPAAWVSQQATLFLGIQKLYFSFVGESFLSVKFSTLPYIFLTSIALFLLARLVFSFRITLIAIFLYTFFAISLYHDTLATLHAGTLAAFIWFFYFLARSLKKPSKLSFFMTGFFGGFCYLFDPKSYHAFPLMIIVYIVALLFQRSKKFLIDIFISIYGFSIVMLPFIGYMLGTKNIYLLQRYQQVDVLKSTDVRLIDNVFLSLKSLYISDIGGSQGFFFGSQALFEPISLILFLVGALFSLIFIKKNYLVGLILFTIFTTFFTGMVMTLPPPAFHRIIVVFPLLVLLMTMPFEKILLKQSFIFFMLGGGLLVVFGISNFIYFKQATRKDTDISVVAARFIEQNYPKRNVYIVAFPNYHVQKVFHFSNDSGIKHSTLVNQSDVLARFNIIEKYVYVIPRFSSDAIGQIKEKDPKASIIQLSSDLVVVAN